MVTLVVQHQCDVDIGSLGVLLQGGQQRREDVVSPARRAAGARADERQAEQRARSLRWRL